MRCTLCAGSRRERDAGASPVRGRRVTAGGLPHVSGHRGPRQIHQLLSHLHGNGRVVSRDDRRSPESRKVNFFAFIIKKSLYLCCCAVDWFVTIFPVLVFWLVSLLHTTHSLTRSPFLFSSHQTYIHINTTKKQLFGRLGVDTIHLTDTLSVANQTFAQTS